MAKQTMLNSHVSFAADQDVGMCPVDVANEVECEEYRPVGGVFPWDDAEGSGAGLHGGEDVGDGGTGDKGVGGGGEGGEGGLGG